MTSAELERNFNFFAPTEPGEGPLPVVFLFHGLGDSAESVIGYTDFDDLVDEGNFLLVVPEGANNTDGSQVFPVDWNTLAAQYNNDNQDLVFFDDMLKCVGEQFNVDADRIYITGMSGGGLMTTFVGLHRTDVVAAIAPMSGGYLQAWPAEVTTRPWLVGWGGENDIAVGTNFNDAANNLIANLLDSENSVIACNHNEEHTWPLAMTPAIWTFLSSFERGVDADPFAEGLPDVFPDYCEIVD
jgi:poly(3-hydroxybutyrate) depolymerase